MSGGVGGGKYSAFGLSHHNHYLSACIRRTPAAAAAAAVAAAAAAWRALSHDTCHRGLSRVASINHLVCFHTRPAVSITSLSSSRTPPIFFAAPRAPCTA